ncbi:hypothetical protein Tco_0859717 [Tanacetum coccineum]|uniref:Uncharacterized protein n=1 Tax=Tanacetum coccineum TaxID=301880 RepID=A0ABQ5BCU3_9ASTR
MILSLDPFVEIPSGESKVHIKILSVLWGNRLPIPDGSLPLSSHAGDPKERDWLLKEYDQGCLKDGLRLKGQDWKMGDSLERLEASLRCYK